ncbi:MobA/MobL family protein [Rubellimicrobium roseum]|uniref:MobA/MobL protein domain-containing protein n=1 Tax=Rubellimicrobium roseum TaxID=687525 RepID=A0A5C4N8H8_9RHOB|nr:MobA/MobL family protein [Rubellimicrobium roseum]TNC68780.1 hypothetical protein FHG71_14235 [Rubellimicrobium roseum]
MSHKACHFEIRNMSRGRGHSAIAAAAYRTAARLFDERTGRWHDYRKKRDVLSVETIGFDGSVEELWQAAEAAETRTNSRVAREWLIALPCELLLHVQVRLV